MKELKIILIDITFIFDQYGYRGIGRYGKDLLRYLIPKIIQDGNWEIHLVGFESLQKNLIEIGFTKFQIEDYLSKLKLHSFGVALSSSWRNIFRWNKLYRPILRKIEPNVFFAIHFERGIPSFGSFKVNKDLKTVVTVHDVIPKITGEYSKKSFIHNEIKKLFFNFMWKGVENADLIIAPSDFTKKDLIKHCNIPEGKIVKIYEGVSSKFFKNKSDYDENYIKQILDRYSIEDSYFFYDSGLEANKGVDNLIDILERLWIKNKKHIPKYFVLTGGGSLNKGVGSNITSRNKNGEIFLKKMVKSNLINNIISTGRVNDDDLICLLQNSSGYIYLSQYEGFGLGPVQSMASEVPVIVSNSSCLPEITGGGALVVDTSNIKKSVKQIDSLLQDKDKQKDLIKKGIIIVNSRYNWDKIAIETWNVLSSLCNNI